MKVNVVMNLKMRCGENPYYDEKIEDTTDNRYSKYAYRVIPYGGTNGPIMAIYDSNGKMVYCSAYYKNNKLYNTINSSITIGKLPSGTYTLKCLSLGKGLYLGESGEAVTFEVPKVDRRYNSNGLYNANNNYGYIDRQTVYVDFLFDYEGLSFDLDVQIVPVGSDIRNVEGIKHATYTYPSYAEMKAECAKYDFDLTYDGYMWQCNYYSNSGAVPYDYLIKRGDILREYKYVEVYEHKGYDNKTFRGKVDVTGVNNDSITAVGFERGFESKGLDFNASENMVTHYNQTSWIYKADRIDGSVCDYYYYNYDEMQLYNHNPINQASRYPATAIGGTYLRPKKMIENYNSYKSNYRVTAYTAKKDEEYYNTSTRFYVNVPVLQFRGTYEYYDLAFGKNIKREWFDNPMNGNQAGENDTPEGNIRARVNYFLDNLKPKAQAALDTAISNGTNEADYYFKKTTTNGILYNIPLDIIFGKYSGDYPIYHYAGTASSGATYTPEYNSNGSLRTLYVDLNRDNAVYNVENKDMHKSANGSIDITGYDFCTDYSTGWKNNLVLRQEIVHLNIEEVPDHQIIPN